MDRKPLFHVKKRMLLAIAGSVWIIAGFNVARLGILSYQMIWPASALWIVLSLVVFGLFGAMFLNMSRKHAKRIEAFEQPTRPFWNFFDLKSYLIMAFMMGGGIWFRSSGFAPAWFIAFFYTGLGLALAVAGVCFWVNFFRFRPTQS